MTQNTASRHQDKFVVRLPDGMRDELKAAAKSNQRTMNSEVVYRLLQSLAADRMTDGARAVRAPLTDHEVDLMGNPIPKRDRGSSEMIEPTTITLTIGPRPDGGVRIHAQGTGVVLSSPDSDEAFADLGPALQTVLDWKAEDEPEPTVRVREGVND